MSSKIKLSYVSSMDKTELTVPGIEEGYQYRLHYAINVTQIFRVWANVLESDN